MSKKKNLKLKIFRKIMAIVLIISAAIAVGIITQALATFDSSVEAGVSMDVMAGNASTVEGMAAIRASAGSLSIIRIVLLALVLLAVIFLIIDLVKDSGKLYKKYFGGKE